MISRIFADEEFSALPAKGLEAQKIRALYNAYGTKYEFCRFYRQGNSFLSMLDGSGVLCSAADDMEEWAHFLSMNGFSELFCSVETAQALSRSVSFGIETVNVMKYCGERYHEPFDSAPALRSAYTIINEGFDIDFEAWYLDMSHRVRHGVSRCCVLDEKAALVIQHDLNCEALLSQVAVLRNERAQGLGLRLIKAVAASLAPSDVYVICEDALTGFYQKCGFAECGKKCVLSL